MAVRHDIWQPSILPQLGRNHIGYCGGVSLQRGNQGNATQGKSILSIYCIQNDFNIAHFYV